MNTVPINSEDLKKYEKGGSTLPVGYIFRHCNSPEKAIEITGPGELGGFAATYQGKRSFIVNRGGIREAKIAIKEFFPYNTNICERDGLKVNPINSRAFNSFIEKFKNEADILCNDNGGNIMRAYDDCFEENGTWYYYMDYIDGGSLYDYVINRQADFSNFVNVWNFLKPLCNGLKKIHNKKLIHCDISPHNILIKDNNPVLIDFGSCLAISQGSNGAEYTQHLTRQPLFSPLEIDNRALYMEKYGKCDEITVCADIFSLGLIMYFMMAPNFFVEYSNKLNNREEDRSLCYKIYKEGFDFPKDMDSRAKEVIEKACKTRIGDRPQNMDAFIKICEDAIKTENVRSIANNTDINISPKIKIYELASNGPLTITLPIDDTSLNSNIIEGYSWRAFLKDNNLVPDSPDFKVGNLKFKRISINAEEIGHSGNYKLFAQ